MTSPVLRLTGVSKNYGGLRPLRIRDLAVGAGEHVALSGLDQAMAEVFVGLVTGAMLPDQGEVEVFGRPTSAIEDSAEWLALVDQLGVVTERAILLDALTVLQNLALPLTLDIDPLSQDTRERATALARAVGLPESAWTRPVEALDAAGRTRVRLARALALDPVLVVLEHPTAAVARPDVPSLAHSVRSVSRARRATTVALTADQAFASLVSDRILVLDAATGRLVESRRWTSRLFGR